MIIYGLLLNKKTDVRRFFNYKMYFGELNFRKLLILVSDSTSAKNNCDFHIKDRKMSNAHENIIDACAFNRFQ
jgi:hypothetical protein